MLVDRIIKVLLIGMLKQQQALVKLVVKGGKRKKL